MRSIPVGLGVVALLICFALLGPGLAPRQEAAGLCLSLLDVGQGDALLLEWPDGDVWLVDGGGTPGSRYDIGAAVVVPELRRRGIETIELVVMTHGDADHVGGLFAVLEQLEVQALLLPRRQHLGAAERTLIGLAEARGVAILVAGEADPLPPTGAAFAALLHPGPGWDAAGDAGINDWSVVLRVGLGAVDFLLTGDVEEAAEAQMLASGLPLRAAVLKLAHHGSRTSSSAAMLDAVAPLVAVASAGADNQFGFPHAAVTGRLQERGTPLYWTGRHGAIRVCTDGFSVRTTRTEGTNEETLWTAEPGAIGAWRSREGPRPGVVLGESAAAKPVVVASRGKRRSSKARARAPRRSKAPAASLPPPEPETPTPTELITDREWERARRERARLRPPWKPR